MFCSNKQGYPRACNICRKRKVKCKGERPVCQTCEASGYGTDCSWRPGQETQIRSKAYVRSLQKRIADLEKYTSSLEGKLEKCQCRNENGGVGNDSLHASLSFTSSEDGAPGPDLTTAKTDQDLADQTRALHFEGEDLQLYGKTSVFQYASTAPGARSRFPELIEDASRSYVLMVDGADESNYNPDFDWSRHLPSEVYLDRREHDRLLDLLFKFYTPWCLRIVPALFLRDMYRALHLPASQTPPKTTHYSPMLHNALVALATAYADIPRLRDLKSRRIFLDKAKKYIDTECHSPNISVVHALAMISNFHSSMGEQTLGYLYFGMSGRISQALGLGIDCSPWVKDNMITHDDMQDRKWAYWTIFAQDVIWSLYVGREFCLSSDQRDIPFPFVDPEFDQILWHHPSSGIPPQPGYLSTTFAATCELLRIGRRIMEVVDMLSNPGTRQEAIYERVSKVNAQLEEWKENLPPAIVTSHANRNTATAPRLMLELVYWWLYILLHRPFCNRTRSTSPVESDIDHVKFCDRAARNIMECLNTWKSLYTLRYVPVTLAQIIFGAGTVFVFSAVQAASGTRNANGSFRYALDQAELCIKYLHEAGRSFQCAKQIAGILANLLQEELRSNVASRTASPANCGPSPEIHDSPGHSKDARYSEMSLPYSQPTSIDYPVLDPSWHVWNSNKTTQQQPTEDGRGNQWPVTEHMTHANNSIVGTSTSLLSFGMGLGMKGGETLSTRPFTFNPFYGDQLGARPGISSNEPSAVALELTAEDSARMWQTLNQRYPYTGGVDSQGRVREMP